MKRIGFIGSGKMASAIIKGLLNANIVDSSSIIATQLNPETIKEKSKSLGVEVITDNKFLSQNSDVIFLAVKPMQIEAVLEEISEFIISDKLIISPAAGVKINKIEKMLPSNARVVRVMPNTPALISEGISGSISTPVITIGSKNATNMTNLEKEMKGTYIVYLYTLY